MAVPALTPEQERRQVALQSMQRFADSGGFQLNYREVEKGEYVQLIGTAPDGREYTVGYEKASDRERLA